MWQIIAALDLEIWAIVKIRRFKSWAETGMYEVVFEQRLLQELPTNLWKDLTEWDLLQFVWILWLYVMSAFPVGRWRLQCFHSDLQAEAHLKFSLHCTMGRWHVQQPWSLMFSATSGVFQKSCTTSDDPNTLVSLILTRLLSTSVYHK